MTTYHSYNDRPLIQISIGIINWLLQSHGKIPSKLQLLELAYTITVFHCIPLGIWVLIQDTLKKLKFISMLSNKLDWVSENHANVYFVLLISGAEAENLKQLFEVLWLRLVSKISDHSVANKPLTNLLSTRAYRIDRLFVDLFVAYFVWVLVAKFWALYRHSRVKTICLCDYILKQYLPLNIFVAVRQPIIFIASFLANILAFIYIL